MVEINGTNIFVGTKEEERIAMQNNMALVNAVRNAGGFRSHATEVGWRGRGCPQSSPYYLYFERESEIYLNLMDGDKPEYVSDQLINAALEFIDKKLNENKQVFIFCSQGQSRSPSIALMYMLEKNLIQPDKAIIEFRDKYYPNYAPAKGMLGYIENRYLTN